MEYTQCRDMLTYCAKGEKEKRWRRERGQEKREGTHESRANMKYSLTANPQQVYNISIFGITSLMLDTLQRRHANTVCPCLSYFLVLLFFFSLSFFFFSLFSLRASFFMLFFINIILAVWQERENQFDVKNDSRTALLKYPQHTFISVFVYLFFCYFTSL